MFVFFLVSVFSVCMCVRVFIVVVVARLLLFLYSGVFIQLKLFQQQQAYRGNFKKNLARAITRGWLYMVGCTMHIEYAAPQVSMYLVYWLLPQYKEAAENTTIKHCCLIAIVCMCGRTAAAMVDVYRVHYCICVFIVIYLDIWHVNVLVLRTCIEYTTRKTNTDGKREKTQQSV